MFIIYCISILIFILVLLFSQNLNFSEPSLIVLFLIQGFAFTYTFEQTDEFNSPELMTNYIKENIDNWSEIQIRNYNIRPYYWYLGLNSPGIESGNTQKIIDSNVSYYISNHPQKNLTNYTEIKNINDLYLYKRNG